MNNGGYILAWVVCFFLIVSVLSAVAVSVSIITSQSTLMQYKEQQAYFTAKSVAGSVADYVINNIDDAEHIESLTVNQGHGSLSNMGDYIVDVSYINSGKIKVSVTANYKGKTSTVTANIVKPPAPSGILPTDNVVFINGSTNSGLGQCTLNGNVYIDGNMELSQGSAINGYAVVKGTTRIAGAGSATKGLFSFGNVTLENSAVIDGDLHTLGDVYMNGSAWVKGNLQADGSLTMLNGRIDQNATLGGGAHFGGGAKLYGSLFYSSNVTCAWGSVSSFVVGGATKITDYTPVDSSPYTSQALPVINVPTQSEMPEMYNTVVINENNKITDSGRITSSVVSQLVQKPWGTTITVEAKGKDINLLLSDTDMNLSNGINIEIDSDGVHNVFIYMTGNSSISVNSNEYVGMKVRSTNPRLFIIGDGEQSISLSSSSELDACVYLPNGSLRATGAPLTTYKFVGSCIVKYAYITNNVLFHYSKPYLEDTPLKIFQSNDYNPGISGWIIESWGVN